MAKTVWNVTDENGVNHTISVKQGGFGGIKITVDDATYKAKSSNWFVNLIDYVVDLPGAICHIVMIGAKADLAVNGKYIGSQEEYKPLGSAPSWIWVLVALSVVGGWFFGGIICCAIGAGLSTLYIKNAIQGNMKKVWMFFAIFCVIAIIFLGLQFFVISALE